jgi:hypothetical protein
MAAETFYSALHWAKKAEASAKLAADLAQTEGKVIQLGFDGAIEDGQLVFKHAPGGVEVPYQLVDDVEYELDLAYNGDLDSLTTMVVKNGNDTVSFVSALHRSSTEPARVVDMDAVMRYDATTGYRWLFKATFKIAPNGAKVFLLYPVVAAKDYNDKTNCITEIPQDIKLELNNGTLTLKAGSKVYVPNGSGVFNAVTIARDIIFTQNSQLGQNFIYVSPTGTSLSRHNNTASGTSVPSGFTGTFYNTSTNAIYYYNNGTQSAGPYSFPIAIVTIGTNNTATVSSIDQVFNGFGYIGSTIFALPGVKGLIPNGRNDDGSLRNIEARTDSVITYTNINSGNRCYSFKSPVNGIWTEINYKTDGSLSTGTQSNNWFFDENANYWMHNGNKSYNWVDFAHSAVNTNSPFAITSFSPKLPFQAVDRNDSSWVAAQAMPSGKYVDLTLGASGSSYTAPANGYFVLNKASTAAKQYVALHVKDDNGNDLLSYQLSATAENHFLGFCQPVMKGHRLVLTYKIDGTTYFFRFIYAEGEK